MIAWIVLISLLAFLAALLAGVIRPAYGFVGMAVIFLFTGLIDTHRFLSQYANPALVSLVFLILVSLALEKTSLLNWLSPRLTRGTPRQAAAKLMTGSALLSAFLSNTAVVSTLLGAVTKQRNLAPSKLLIPLSYASVLGGVTTLVGTSTNLVVNSFYLDATGESLHIFSFAWVGLPVAFLSLCMVLWRTKKLPENGVAKRVDRQNYFLTAKVSAGSPLAGHSIRHNGLRRLDGLYLLEIERNGHVLSPVTPEEILQQRDRLIFSGDVGRAWALEDFKGLELHGARSRRSSETNLVEVIISHESGLQGKTLQQADFRSKFNAGVIGIRRGDKRLQGQLGKIVLHVGDCLLLAAGRDFQQHQNLGRNFHILDHHYRKPALPRRESSFVLLGFSAVILLAGLNLVPLLHGLMVFLIALLVRRCLNIAELRRRFPFEIWLIIGSALVIAKVFTSSGAAGLVTRGLTDLVGDWGPYAALIGCYLLTLAFTETVTNNAAAALTFPVAWSMAQAMDVSPLPFVMIVAYGASACFLIPFGYQTHLMVYSAGHYRVRDFARFGWPVSLVYSLGVLVLTPWFFPF